MSDAPGSWKDALAERDRLAAEVETLGDGAVPDSVRRAAWALADRAAELHFKVSTEGSIEG